MKEKSLVRVSKSAESGHAVGRRGKLGASGEVPYAKQPRQDVKIEFTVQPCFERRVFDGFA